MVLALAVVASLWLRPDAAFGGYVVSKLPTIVAAEIREILSIYSLLFLVRYRLVGDFYFYKN